MQLTTCHAKCFAYELTKRCSSHSIGKLAASLPDAQVDLNPHQVEAALFAFRSPFSKRPFFKTSNPSLRSRMNGQRKKGEIEKKILVLEEKVEAWQSIKEMEKKRNALQMNRYEA